MDDFLIRGAFFLERLAFLLSTRPEACWRPRAGSSQSRSVPKTDIIYVWRLFKYLQSVDGIVDVDFGYNNGLRYSDGFGHAFLP